MKEEKRCTSSYGRTIVLYSASLKTTKNPTQPTFWHNTVYFPKVAFFLTADGMLLLGNGAIMKPKDELYFSIGTSLNLQQKGSYELIIALFPVV